MSIQVIILLLLGGAAGFLNGFIGSGAGVLIVPVMVILGYSQVEHASSLAVAVSCWSAMFFCVPYFIKNRKDQEWICAVTLFVAGAATAHLGVAFAVESTPLFTRLALSFCAFACLDILSRHERKLNRLTDEESEARVWINPQANLVKYVVFGAFTAFLGGIVGSAGGLFLLPLLVHYTGMRVKQAVYACLVMMAGSSLSALYGQAEYGAINFELGIPLAIGAVVGGIFGGIALEIASDKTIRLLVKLFLAEVGLFLLIWGLIF